MKKFLKYSLIPIVFFFSSFISVDDVVTAIKTGSATQLSKYIETTVDITFTDKKNTYSKSQAEIVLKDFFENNAVKNFDIVHKGDNPNAPLIIGTLDTKAGEYKTTIYMKQKGDKQLLQEIRFEK